MEETTTQLRHLQAASRVIFLCPILNRSARFVQETIPSRDVEGMVSFKEMQMVSPF